MQGTSPQAKCGLRYRSSATQMKWPKQSHSCSTTCWSAMTPLLPKLSRSLAVSACGVSPSTETCMSRAGRCLACLCECRSYVLRRSGSQMRGGRLRRLSARRLRDGRRGRPGEPARAKLRLRSMSFDCCGSRCFTASVILCEKSKVVVEK